MEDNREKILQFIRIKGPILPVEISKHINTNILLASAHLSELSANGKLKVSGIKIGGSPLYYLPGQEAQLEKFADNLNEKEKRAHDLLSQKKILRDNELDPLTRVTLRSIKDYAIPLQVDYKGNSEIFWRWFLIGNKEAEEFIKPYFEETEPKKEEPKKEIKEEKKPQEREIQRKIEEPQKLEKPKTIKKEKAEGAFSERITFYFNKNKINILSKQVIRKSEIDFIIQIPSPVGNLEYYCKSRDKQKINDADLASAFVQGQLKKLPILFLTNGELTKRAKEMLQKDFKGMNIINI